MNGTALAPPNEKPRRGEHSGAVNGTLNIQSQRRTLALYVRYDGPISFSIFPSS
jgi:hypothetical protein